MASALFIYRRGALAMSVSGEALGDWLVLHHAPGIGPTTFARLLRAFGDPRGVLRAGRGALADSGLLRKPSLDWLMAPDWGVVEAEVRWAGEEGNHILVYTDEAYPVLLRQIDDPPMVLYVHGRPDALSRPTLAIVGSRNPSPSGEEAAHAFAEYLARGGYTIASGMAIGIDAAAHKGALAANGLTVAVAGTGLDRVYPARHRDLAHRIAGQGALVSEFPLGMGPQRANFPRRNRILSGLSLGVIVVEAALKSGSLITARHAMEQGREVFAIPGSIHNPLARGCHWMIRQGAKLVETAQDIVEELGPLGGALEGLVMQWPAGPVAAAPGHAGGAEGQSGPGPAPANAVDNDLEQDESYGKLLDCLGHDPVPVDLLVERTGLTPDVVSSMLLILELRGLIASHPGGVYARS